MALRGWKPLIGLVLVLGAVGWKLRAERLAEEAATPSAPEAVEEEVSPLADLPAEDGGPVELALYAPGVRLSLSLPEGMTVGKPRGRMIPSATGRSSARSVEARAEGEATLQGVQLWALRVPPTVEVGGREGQRLLRGFMEEAVSRYGATLRGQRSLSLAGASGQDALFEGVAEGRPALGRVAALRLGPQLAAVIVLAGEDVAMRTDPRVEEVLASLEVTLDQASQLSVAEPVQPPDADEEEDRRCRAPAPARTTREVDPGDLPLIVGRARGCVVLVEVWATWCQACVRAFPEVQRIAEDHRGAGLVVTPVVASSPAEELRRFLRSQQVWVFPLRLRESERGALSQAIAQLGGDYPGAIPYFALLDREGALITQGTGSRTLGAIEGRLEGLLAAR